MDMRAELITARGSRQAAGGRWYQIHKSGAFRAEVYLFAEKVTAFSIWLYFTDDATHAKAIFVYYM